MLPIDTLVRIAISKCGAGGGGKSIPNMASDQFTLMSCSIYQNPLNKVISILISSNCEESEQLTRLAKRIQTYCQSMASLVYQHAQYTHEQGSDPEIQNHLSSGISPQSLRQIGPYYSRQPDE